jgi:hypothetical protein
MSFITYINALKVRLENNADLQNYFVDKFGEGLTVKKVFKDRTAIDQADLPLCMITRPDVGRTPAGNATKREHSVLLYVGWPYEDLADLEKPLEYFIDIDDLLEVAVMTKSQAAGDMGMYIAVEDSANDEGLYHPIYFQTMHLKIKEQK